jgi:hypothetical protein
VSLCRHRYSTSPGEGVIPPAGHPRRATKQERLKKVTNFSRHYDAFRPSHVA